MSVSHWMTQIWLKFLSWLNCLCLKHSVFYKSIKVSHKKWLWNEWHKMTLSYISLLPSWFPLQKRPQIAYSILTQIFCRIRCNCTLSFVGPSVSPSTYPSHFNFLICLCSSSSLSSPYAIVPSNRAPAHPHVTAVAVHPALLLMKIA